MGRYPKEAGRMANNAEPDQTASSGPKKQSDLAMGLQCLPLSVWPYTYYYGRKTLDGLIHFTAYLQSPHEV